MNGNPTKAQSEWQKWLRGRGCCVQSNMSYGYASIHHIAGSKVNLKGVKGFGEWYVLCLSYWWHQDGRNKAARHINKKSFERETGKTEKEWFIESVEEYIEQVGHPPMSNEEYQIIKERLT